MSRTGNHLHKRYVVAILATTVLMVWISVNEEGRSSAIPVQTAFWTVAVGAGWLQMIVISRGIRSVFGHDRWPGWVLLLVSTLVGAVPLSFEVRWLLESIVAPATGLPPPWLTYLNVSVINTVFGLVQYILIERWPLSDRTTVPDRPVSVPVNDHQPTAQSPPGMRDQQILPTPLDTKVRKYRRKWTIVTTDGTVIPVGRSFESSLRKAGWL